MIFVKILIKNWKCNCGYENISGKNICENCKQHGKLIKISLLGNYFYNKN